MKSRIVSRRVAIQFAVVVVFFATLWLILWRQLSGEWSVNDQYSYGWFVPFFAALLFWLRWEDRPQAVQLGARSLELGDQRSEISGHRSVVGGRWSVVGITIVALLLLFPVRLFEIGNPDWRPLNWLHAICVVAITFAFLWSIGGGPWLRHFAFPVAFTLVAVPWISPIETPIIQGLMRIIAAFAAEFANLLGIPAQVQGNLIHVRTGLIGVNEACSGVRSLQTSLMIGLLFGELKRLSLLQRTILVVGAIAIAMIANFLRAVLLVWIGASEGISAIDKWHDVAGYGIVVVVFIGSLLLAQFLAKSGYRLSVNRSPRRSLGEGGLSVIGSQLSVRGAYTRPSFIVAAICWLALIEFAATGWYRAHEKNVVVTPRWTVQWPTNAAGFHESKIDEGVRSTLRYDEAKEAAWNVSFAKTSKASDQQPILGRCISFFSRWKPGGSSVVRARAHRPDICLPSVGWRQVADYGVKNYSARSDLAIPFHHLAFADNRGVIAHTFFCLQEDEVRPSEPRPDLQVSGGSQPDWSLRGRSRVVWSGARNLGQQILEVVLISPDSLDDARAEKEFGGLVPSIVKVEGTKRPQDN